MPRVCVNIENLIIRLKAKEVEALATLYDFYSKSLYNVIYRIVKCVHVAEDILQDSFIKIWFKIEKYDPLKGSFFTWMLNICRNSAIDYLRSNRKSLRILSNDEIAQIYSTKFSSIQPDYSGIRDVVLKLEASQVQVLNLLYFEGFTQSEAAEELNIPLGTIKSKVRSALKILRKECGVVDTSY